MREDLSQEMLRHLGKAGLLEMSRDPNREDTYQIRTTACLPYVHLHGAETCANSAQVRLCLQGDRAAFVLQEPYPGTVIHPDWGVDGHWDAPRATQFRAAEDPDALAELLLYMIKSLNMKAGTIRLDPPGNRNAVNWCYENGRTPIRVVNAGIRSPAAESWKPAVPPKTEKPPAPPHKVEILFSKVPFPE